MRQSWTAKPWLGARRADLDLEQIGRGQRVMPDQTIIVGRQTENRSSLVAFEQLSAHHSSPEILRFQ
jgi:hypothetical protein